VKDIALVAGDNELDVEMVPIVVAPPRGEILEIEWKRYSGTDVWHSLSDPMPSYTDVYHRWKVKNTGDGTFYFNIGQYQTGYGEGWYYTNHPVQLSPNEEGYIEDVFGTGKPRSPFSFTWYLFGDATPLTGYQGKDKETKEWCDSITVTVTVV